MITTCTVEKCEAEAIETIRMRNGVVIARLCTVHFEDYAYFFTKTFLQEQQKIIDAKGAEKK